MISFIEKERFKNSGTYRQFADTGFLTIFLYFTYELFFLLLDLLYKIAVFNQNVK